MSAWLSHYSSVKDQMGYENLCRLASIAYLEGFYYTPRIDKELLDRVRTRGLFASRDLSKGENRLSHILQEQEKKSLGGGNSFFPRSF